MALTDKQEAFVREYLVDLNATQAAIRAGYSEHTAVKQGSRLLTNADIRARIDELLERRKEKLEIDAEWVVGRLIEVSEMALRAKPVMKWDYNERELVETGEYQFDSTGANKALELIGKHLGMFTDKVKMDVNGQVKHDHEYYIEQTITTDAESAELLKQLYKRQRAVGSPMGDPSET